MRILMFAWVFWPHVGGVEKHVERVGRVLVRRGHEVKVFTVAHDRNLPEREEHDGIEVLRFQKRNPDDWERRRIMWWLFRRFDLFRWAQVIHCHDFMTFHYWYLPFRFLYFRKPVYITFHGYEGYPLSSRIIRIRRFDNRMVWGSLAIGDFIVRWYGTHHDFISYGGVDVPPGDPGEPETDAALFVGQLREDTSILVYLDALRELRTTYGIDLPLDVCGDGPLRREVERRIERDGLNVIMHGMVHDTTPYLLRCRFAFVSSYLAILEAMVYRQAVFSVYGNPLKRDYLCLIPQAERMLSISSGPSEIAREVAALMADRTKLAERLDAAHRFARAHSWEQMADLYLSLYRRRGGKERSWLGGSH